MAGAQPTPNISSRTVTTLLPGSGQRRGVVVLNHGLNVGTNMAPPPSIIDNTVGGITALYTYLLTLANLLTADGWIVIQPPQVGDQYVSSPNVGIPLDISGDAGTGTRYLAEILTWWQYVVAYITRTYGNVPIVPFGFSLGAYLAVKIANLAPQTIVAYGGHCLPTILPNLSSAFVGSGWAALGHGADILTTDLNGVNLPGIIGYGTGDTAVGYNSAGTGGTPVSNTDALITAAQAANSSSRKPARNSTSDAHGLLVADTNTYAAATTGWFATDVDTFCPKFF